ncbi:MAG: hypothetical protein ACYDCI_00275 [Candidatus Limnocylindrales bacterium]
MPEIIATPRYNDDVPTFDGQAVFGSQAAITAQQLVPGIAGSAAAIDAFLGLTPGTTRYGAEPGGSLWGVTGAFVASSSGAVSAIETAFVALAGITATLGLPTNQTFPSDFEYLAGCYFTGGDFAASSAGIVSTGGGMYSLSYAVVFRQTHSG